MPSVTYKVWPFGCVCHAVRAPGVKRTCAQPMHDCSSGLRIVSMKTVPVNQASGPRAVCPPLLVKSTGPPLAIADFDECLDRPTFIHGGVRLGDVVEIRRHVEDLARVDVPSKDGLQKLRLIAASGCRTTSHADISVEGAFSVDESVMRYAHSPNDRAGLGDGE